MADRDMLPHIDFNHILKFLCQEVSPEMALFKYIVLLHSMVGALIS